MISASAGVVLTGGGKLAGPGLPVLDGHGPGDVAGALGEAVQLGQGLVGRTAGLDTVAGQVVVRSQAGVDRETGAQAAQSGLVVTKQHNTCMHKSHMLRSDHKELVNRAMKS